METTTMPLYKMLNEKRTQGVLEIESKPFWGNRVRLNIPDLETGLTTVFVIEDYTDNKQQAETNAQYTALAVNHLHLLAEALEGFVNDIENHPSIAAREHYKPLMDKAKEALNRIS